MWPNVHNWNECVSKHSQIIKRINYFQPSDWSILRLEDTLRGSPPSGMGGHLAPLPSSLPVPSPLSLSSASPLSLHNTGPNGLGGNSLPSPFSHQPSAGYLNLGNYFILSWIIKSQCHCQCRESLQR